MGFIFVNDTSGEMSATGSSVAPLLCGSELAEQGGRTPPAESSPGKVPFSHGASLTQSRSFSPIPPLSFPSLIVVSQSRLETKLVFKTILNTSFTMRPDTIDCECEPVY